MLLRHPWLAPLLKPPIISESEENNEPPAVEEDGTTPVDTPTESPVDLLPVVVDEEVATWVRQAIEKRRESKLGKRLKPALHAAPLNVVPA